MRKLSAILRIYARNYFFPRLTPVKFSNCIESLAGSGWLLHPLSIKTIKQIQIAYLARPGFPGLIEVHQKENWNECENKNNLFITEIFAPMDTKFLPLIQSLNLETVVKPSTNGLQFTMGGHTIKMQDLL